MSIYQTASPAGAIDVGESMIGSWPRHGHNIGWRAFQLVHLALRLFGRALAEYRTRRAVRELQRLDERMLHDIGIRREAIDHVVRYGRELDVAPFAREWASCGADPLRR